MPKTQPYRGRPKDHYAEVRLAPKPPQRLPELQAKPNAAPPPPRKFYPVPRTNEEAFALIPMVLADVDERRAAEAAAAATRTEQEAPDAGVS
jgi:hypothetical protein